MTRLLTTSIAALLLVPSVSAFPGLVLQSSYRWRGWCENNEHQRDTTTTTTPDEACTYPPMAPSGAAPYDPAFPYTGARDGKPGTGKGLVKVPADGDTAHAFVPPGPGDLRGPCPGLNALANHNFISHNGVTTRTELITGLQNMYNAGHDFATFASTLGVAQVGNITTEQISIGDCGLNKHGAIEADTSLTRNDEFFTHDDWTFNTTLFKGFAETVNYYFNRSGIADWRAIRYDHSRNNNPQFNWPTKSMLMVGASSFVYELMPSYANWETRGDPDFETISSFFGAVRDPTSESGYRSVPERLPPNWVNRPTPYTLRNMAANALKTYLAHPREFGQNLGELGKFQRADDLGIVKDGFVHPRTTDGEAFCHYYKMVVAQLPKPGTPNAHLTEWVTERINPVFDHAGCF